MYLNFYSNNTFFLNSSEKHWACPEADSFIDFCNLRKQGINCSVYLSIRFINSMKSTPLNDSALVAAFKAA